MKRTKLAIAFSLAALVPFAVAAQEAPSNTWVEGSYVNVDGDADGHALRGSFEFGETNLYGLGGLSRVHVDDELCPDEAAASEGRYWRATGHVEIGIDVLPGALTFLVP